MTESYEELHARLTKDSPFLTYEEVEAGLLKDIECRLVSSSEERGRWKKVLTAIPETRTDLAKTLLAKTELTSEEIIRACLAGTGTTVKIDDDLEGQISDQENFDIGRHRAAEALGKIDTPPNFRVAPNMFQFDRDQYELGRAAAKSVLG